MTPNGGADGGITIVSGPAAPKGIGAGIGAGIITTGGIMFFAGPINSIVGSR
jgi:hypothetical protein